MASTSSLDNQQIVIDQALAAAAMDFSDVLYYASPTACPDFKKVAEDHRCSIKVSSKSMGAYSPINMMRASVIMPCSPSEFVRFMEPDARKLWDEHYKYGKLVRKVKPIGIQSNETPAVVGDATSKSSSEGDFPQLKIFEFNSPVPSFIRSRDFELVMSQKVNSFDGTALVKGFSTPKGYLLPLRYKSGPAEAEGRRAEGEALKQRAARFREALGVDISSLETESMQRLLKTAQESFGKNGKEATNLTPPSQLNGVGGMSLPGLVGVPAMDTASFEATVRGTIVFSGFVATPIFEDDNQTLNALPSDTRKLIAEADRNRKAAGPLSPQSPLFSYPYATEVNGRRIIASRVTYVALIQPQGNVHPMFVNIVVRMQTKGLKQMQRAIAQHPVKVLDEKLMRSRQQEQGGGGGGGLLSKL